MSSQTQQDRYLALMHLNDAGIFLLQQNQIRQAFSTFYSATLLIPEDEKSNPQNDDRKPAALVPTGTDELTKTCTDAVKLLERTQQLMLDPEVFPESALTKTHVFVISDFKTASDAEKMLDLQHSNLGYAIFRIREIIHNKNGQQSNIGNRLNAAVAMYNFGIVHAIYSNTLGSDDLPIIRERHQSQSRAWLHRSDYLLKRILSEIKSHEKGKYFFYFILAIRSVVLLCRQEQVAGTERAEKIQEKLSRISSNMNSLKSSTKLNRRAANAA